MSYWRSGLTRYRTGEPSVAKLQDPSSASIITIGAILTTLVIVGTLALHERNPSGDGNRWAMPLPTTQLEQPAMPAPMPVRPAPTSSSPIATAATGDRPTPPPPRKPERDQAVPPSAPSSAPVPVIPEAGSRISLITVDDVSLRVRYRNSRLRVDPVGPRSPAQDRADTTFDVRSGLADGRCLSLEAANVPGHYVRHWSFDLYLHRREASGLYAADATFCAQPVGSTGGFVLRSVNYPDRYLTVRDSMVQLSRVPVGIAQQFRVAAAL